MPPTLKATVVGLVMLSAFFFVFERVAGHRHGPFFRRAWVTDALYFLCTPFAARAVSRMLILLPLLLLVLGGAATVEGLRARQYDGFGPLGRQPIALQAIEVFLLADLIAYWTHRKFHRGRWWPFHAVHHSSEDPLSPQPCPLAQP